MLTNQLLVVAPRQSNVRSLLLKYASLFGIVALCSVMISVLSPVFGPESLLRGSMNNVNSAPQVALGYDGGTAAKALAENVARNVTATHEVILTATKGAADMWAANATPALAPVPVPTTMIAAPTLPPGSMESGAGTVFPALDPALAFFLGGLLVIFILVCYEAWIWKKNYK
jgi:hypothetical protein